MNDAVSTAEVANESESDYERYVNIWEVSAINPIEF
jgi:hypothetical protein